MNNDDHRKVIMKWIRMNWLLLLLLSLFRIIVNEIFSLFFLSFFLWLNSISSIEWSWLRKNWPSFCQSLDHFKHFILNFTKLFVCLFSNGSVYVFLIGRDGLKCKEEWKSHSQFVHQYDDWWESKNKWMIRDFFSTFFLIKSVKGLLWKPNMSLQWCFSLDKFNNGIIQQNLKICWGETIDRTNRR